MNKSELYDRAQGQIRKGNWDKAIELMGQVHRLDESDAMVTLRLGDLYKKLGFDRDASEFYLKTADLYASTDAKTKAAAIYKMVLRINPELDDAQRKLDVLSASRQAARAAVPAPPPAAAPEPEAPRQAMPPMPEPPGPSAPMEPSQPAAHTEIYYGSSEHRAETSKADIVHETIPGLVELGSTVGRLVADDEFAPRPSTSNPSPPPSGIELSTGGEDIKIESFAMNKVASREPDAPAMDEGVVGGGSGISSYDIPPPPPASGDALFSDFAADVEAAPTAQPPNAPARKEIEFLGDLAEDELWELLGRMNRLTFGPGEAIIREGESGDSIYIISSGKVMVSSTKNGMTVKLAELNENDFFGEVSFLTGKTRTADVIAMETTTVMELSRTETDGLIRKYPQIERVLRMFQKERVADTIATMKAVSHLW